VSFISPDYVVLRVHQFQFGLQFDLPGKMTLASSYVGSRTRKYPVSQAFSVVPLAQQIESLGVSNYWNRAVPNPFFGAPEMAGTGYAGATITNALAWTTFPQFTGVTVQGLPTGGTNYNSLVVRLNKRVSHGLSFSGSYTFSKMTSSTFYRTNWDTQPFWQIDPLDTPHHLALSTFWDLPFGKGRSFGAGWNKTLDRVAGGWALNFTVEKSSGIAIPTPGGE
jgi:hypothetical protein